jgi:hypothetical protein
MTTESPDPFSGSADSYRLLKRGVIKASPCYPFESRGEHIG